MSDTSPAAAPDEGVASFRMDCPTCGRDSDAPETAFLAGPVAPVLDTAFILCRVKCVDCVNGHPIFPRYGHRKFPSRRPFGRLGIGLCPLQEAGLDLLLEPVAVAADGDGDPVVQEPVEDRRGDDPIPEDVPPVGEALVGGEDHRDSGDTIGIPGTPYLILANSEATMSYRRTGGTL